MKDPSENNKSSKIKSTDKMGSNLLNFRHNVKLAYEIGK